MKYQYSHLVLFKEGGGAHLPKNLPLIFYLEVANRVYRTNKPIILMLPKKKYVSGGGGVGGKHYFDSL